MAKSEITRLRQQIEAEYIAAHRALYEFATVGKHEIITNRFNQAGHYIDQLAQLVGEEEAQYISTEIYMQTSADETTQEDHTTACGQTLQTPQVEEDTITVKAHLNWEGAQFLRDHGCHIEHSPTDDLITFPPGSRKARLTRISRHCNTITLPDATEITSIDSDNTPILLLIDLVNEQTMHLTH